MSRRRAKDSLKKGVYVLPNLITSASLCAGFYSITSTFNQRFEHAAVAILAAAIFDGLDGRVARMTHTTTRFGVEYDSLADLVSFGVAPALLIYEWALRPFGRVGWVGAFLYMICGALRLARFNVQINTVEKGKFNGLPIPGAATFIASGIWAWHGFMQGGSGPGSPLVSFPLLGSEWTVRPFVVLASVYVLAFLMVSTVKFNSFKDLDPFLRRPFNTLVLFVLFMLLLLSDPPVMVFLSIAAYVVSGPAGELLGALRRRRSGNPSQGGRTEDGDDAH